MAYSSSICNEMRKYRMLSMGMKENVAESEDLGLAGFCNGKYQDSL